MYMYMYMYDVQTDIYLRRSKVTAAILSIYMYIALSIPPSTQLL